MQHRLVFDSLDDALGEVVRGLGGAKMIGARLRPELAPDQAGNWLRDCLNPARREHLNSDQIMVLLRWGREAGLHAGIEYLTATAGYESPRPISPKDEAAALMERATLLAQESRLVAQSLEKLARAVSK